MFPSTRTKPEQKENHETRFYLTKFTISTSSIHPLASLDLTHSPNLFSKPTPSPPVLQPNSFLKLATSLPDLITFLSTSTLISAFLLIPYSRPFFQTRTKPELKFPLPYYQRPSTIKPSYTAPSIFLISLFIYFVRSGYIHPEHGTLRGASLESDQWTSTALPTSYIWGIFIGLSSIRISPSSGSDRNAGLPLRSNQVRRTHFAFSVNLIKTTIFQKSSLFLLHPF